MVLLAAAIVVAFYAVAAYALLPSIWSHYEHEPQLAGREMVTTTREGIPADPLNVALVGTKEEAVRALAAAGWYPADAVTLKTAIEIAGSVLLDRPYRDAPVSALFYEGREQDLAFEKPVGTSADRRHHVRFWLVLDESGEGRPLFLGSATFDRGAGFSHDTGELTHHIAPDIDAEREFLIAALTGAEMLTATYQVLGIGPTLRGRNGGGDLYYSDGEVWVGVLSVGAKPAMVPPVALPTPPAVMAKDALFAAGRALLGGGSPEEGTFGD